jgi:peroxiredoxin (alkyl hydroperoxide reductase subunit C)
MPDMPAGCATPSKGPIAPKEQKSKPKETETEKEVSMEIARVGKPAPDFELTAFHGEGFKNVRLSDYKGKWIVICFYPGDFTFV